MELLSRLFPERVAQEAFLALGAKIEVQFFVARQSVVVGRLGSCRFIEHFAQCVHVILVEIVVGDFIGIVGGIHFDSDNVTAIVIGAHPFAALVAGEMLHAVSYLSHRLLRRRCLPEKPGGVSLRVHPLERCRTKPHVCKFLYYPSVSDFQGAVKRNLRRGGILWQLKQLGRSMRAGDAPHNDSAENFVRRAKNALAFRAAV
jgi:hypothetical protein